MIISDRSGTFQPLLLKRMKRSVRQGLLDQRAIAGSRILGSAEYLSWPTLIVFLLENAFTFIFKTGKVAVCGKILVFANPRLLLEGVVGGHDTFMN